MKMLICLVEFKAERKFIWKGVLQNTDKITHGRQKRSLELKKTGGEKHEEN